MREGSLSGPIEAEAVSAARGREQALRSLAGRVARRGYRIAFDLLRSREEAEDAVQEALTRACASWERLRDADALDGWFYRILTNHCLSVLRRRRAWRAIGGVLRRGRGEPDEAPAETVDPAPGADQALARGRETRAVLAAVDRLPPMQRAAVLLRYGHDLPVAEVAALLGIELGTAKTHLLRGLERLRREVGEGRRP